MQESLWIETSCLYFIQVCPLYTWPMINTNSALDRDTILQNITQAMSQIDLKRILSITIQSAGTCTDTGCLASQDTDALRESDRRDSSLHNVHIFPTLNFRSRRSGGQTQRNSGKGSGKVKVWNALSDWQATLTTGRVRPSRPRRSTEICSCCTAGRANTGRTWRRTASAPPGPCRCESSPTVAARCRHRRRRRSRIRDFRRDFATSWRPPTSSREICRATAASRTRLRTCPFPQRHIGRLSNARSVVPLTLPTSQHSGVIAVNENETRTEKEHEFVRANEKQKPSEYSGLTSFLPGSYPCGLRSWPAENM